MATKLFSTTDRGQSHKKLEEVLAEHPRAECRENPADPEGTYSVWDGPEERASQVQPAAAPTDSLDRLADLLAPRLLARMKKSADESAEPEKK